MSLQGTDLRVLIVDDNAVNRRVARSILKNLGINAEEASSGFEALGILERKPYDLILMDVQMPRMDGLETTRKIRQKNLQHNCPMIVAVTADGDRDACIASGMNDYIAKPVTPAAFKSVLEGCKAVEKLHDI